MELNLQQADIFNFILVLSERAKISSGRKFLAIQYYGYRLYSIMATAPLVHQHHHIWALHRLLLLVVVAGAPEHHRRSVPLLESPGGGRVGARTWAPM